MVNIILKKQIINFPFENTSYNYVECFFYPAVLTVSYQLDKECLCQSFLFLNSVFRKLLVDIMRLLFLLS